MKTFQNLNVVASLTALHGNRVLQGKVSDRSILRSILTMIACVFVLGILSSSAQVPTFKNIYVFGDSLSDTGNFFKATGGTRPASLPYYQGRFSNGPVWPEYLAQQLQVPTTQLNNFAVAGASSGLYSSYVSDPQSPMYRTGLLSQVDQFIASNTSPDPQDLFIIWAGLNDYAGRTQQPVSEVVDNITSAINQLAAVGARTILVVNLPDLGALPAATNKDLSATLTEVTIAHNHALASAVKSLATALHPSNIVLYDIYSELEETIQHPERFAIVDVRDSCIGNTGYPFSPPSNIAYDCAATPNEYIFWDSVHPTTAVHRLIAAGAYSALGGSAAFHIAPSDNHAHRITPGTRITIAVSGFADSAISLPGPPYPRFLETSSVQIDGLYAPLLYVNPTKVMTQVPCSVSPGPAIVTVNTARGAASVLVIIHQRELIRDEWSKRGEPCHDVNASSTASDE